MGVLLGGLTEDGSFALNATGPGFGDFSTLESAAAAAAAADVLGDDNDTQDLERIIDQVMNDNGSLDVNALFDLVESQNGTFDVGHGFKRNFKYGFIDSAPPVSKTFDFVVEGVLLMIVSIFGVAGNIINIVVLSKPSMKGSFSTLLIGQYELPTVQPTPLSVTVFPRCCENESVKHGQTQPSSEMRKVHMCVGWRYHDSHPFSCSIE